MANEFRAVSGNRNENDVITGNQVTYTPSATASNVGNLIVNGVTIPKNGNYIKVGGTNITKVDAVQSGVRTTVWEKQTIPSTITSGLWVSRVFIDEFAETQHTTTANVLNQNPINGSARWKCTFYPDKYDLTMVKNIKFAYTYYYHDNSAYNPHDEDSYPKKYFYNGAYFYFGVGSTYRNQTIISSDPFSTGVCSRIGSHSYTATWNGTNSTKYITLDVTSLTGQYYIGIAVRGINMILDSSGNNANEVTFNGYDVPALTDCWNQGRLNNWHSHYHTEQTNASMSVSSVSFTA